MTGLPDLGRRDREELRTTTDPVAGVPSIGQIAGLRPRRRPGDGGEVSHADVDLLDALDPSDRRTVAGWLEAGSSPGTRRVRLRVMASFLRWLRVAEPDADLLAVTGPQVDRYCDAALDGRLPGGEAGPGRSLAGTTVARKRAVLTSFYVFAWRCGATRPGRPPAAGAADGRAGNGAAALTRDERRLLRRGIERLAGEGRAAEAAALALLDATGAPVEALAGVTAQDLRTVAGVGGGDGGEQAAVVVVRAGRDDRTAFPLPPLACRLLRELHPGRSGAEPLLRRDDDEPVDSAWLGAALTSAALAGGIPRRRAARLDPRMMLAAPAASWRSAV
ncbi:hypothetical protein [Nonomuraea sp. NPDC050405]|uniref:hypothetical protein n=2 Tax=unclassified Nonomuraea TaxID=2593643 RepID=UPI0033DA15DD